MRSPSAVRGSGREERRPSQRHGEGVGGLSVVHFPHVFIRAVRPTNQTAADMRRFILSGFVFVEPRAPAAEAAAAGLMLRGRRGTQLLYITVISLMPPSPSQLMRRCMFENVNSLSYPLHPPTT